jgi:hypothetical protein
MDARTVMHPVGPLPPRVYWLRRLIPLGALALLILVVALACSGGSDPSRPTASTPTTSPSASPTRSSGSVAACTSDQLAVVASTDADSYAAGTLPQLKVAIRNTSFQPCRLTESPSTRTWTIVSGTDQVWSTEGCASSHTATVTTLKPGKSVRHSTAWNRHRSDKQCNVSDATADPGTYQLTVTVDGVTSPPAVFHLTG